MAPNNLTKKLIDAGITANTDGLLRDFVGRGMYRAAIGTLNEAIDKRKSEVDFLENFKKDLAAEILEDEEV